MLAATDHLDRGSTYCQLGRFDDALDELALAIQMGVKPLYRAYHDRGVASSGLNRLDAAVGDFTLAIQHNPEAATSYTCRGALYERLGQYDAALSDHSRAIQLDPKLALAYTNRGVALHSLGRSEEALADLAEAIRLEPRGWGAYEQRGNLLDGLNRLEGRERQRLRFADCTGITCNAEMRVLDARVFCEVEASRGVGSQRSRTLRLSSLRGRKHQVAGIHYERRETQPSRARNLAKLAAAIVGKVVRSKGTTMRCYDVQVVRTTINLDDDVLDTTRAIARAERRALGACGIRAGAPRTCSPTASNRRRRWFPDFPRTQACPADH